MNEKPDVISAYIELEQSIATGRFVSPQEAFLLGAIARSDDREEQCILYSLLANQYGIEKRKQEVLSAWESAIKADPSDPQAHIGLAGFYLLDNRKDEAEQEAECAVKVAHDVGRYRRHALHTLARVLRSKQDFSRLELVLRELISLQPGGQDIAVEADFLVNLPEGVLPADLVNQYQSQRRR